MLNRTTLTLATAALTLAAQDAPHTDQPPPAESAVVTPAQPPSVGTRAVDLAICLDTSGSMNGLIEAAKQKLWSIVNDLALAEPQPVLRVALLTYGNDGHNAEEGWVRLDVPLTTDLDLISQRLFELTTNGGTELVGRVVDKATHALDWSQDPQAMKLIVVAGNESADQDQVIPFRTACKNAITTGVMINSIYCGGQPDPVASGWKEVATLADGHYATIDHNTGLVVVETPFDAQLNALSISVNHTYVPLGDVGRVGWANQVAQDANAESLNGAACASRALTKGGHLYSKAWDLVELTEAADFDWTTVKDADLPECMRAMDLAARRAYLTELRTKRMEIHRQIAELSKKRDAWVLAYKRLNGLDESKAFDGALRGALRLQAEAKGFKFREEQHQQPTPEELEALMKEIEASAPPQQPAGQTAGKLSPQQPSQSVLGAKQQVQQIQQQQQVGQQQEQGPPKKQAEQQQGQAAGSSGGGR